MVLEELFYSDALPYAAAFLAFFALIFFLLNKSMFKENRAVSTILAVCSSALIVWGLGNYTDLMGTFGFFLEDFAETTRAVIFIAVMILILLLLWKGFSKTTKNYKIPFVRLALTILLAFAFFADKIFSIYAIPEFIFDLKWIWFVAAIGMGIWTIASIKKDKFLKIKLKT
jgi:hypothetical protein